MNRPLRLQRRIDRQLIQLTLIGTGLAALVLAVVVTLMQRQVTERQVQLQAQQSERDLLEQLTSGQSLERVQRQLQITAAADHLKLALVVNQRGMVIAANDGALVGKRFSRQLLDPISDAVWDGIWPCLPSARSWWQHPRCRQPFGHWTGKATAPGSYHWLSVSRTPLAFVTQPGLEQSGLLVLSLDVRRVVREALNSGLITVGTGMLLLLLTSGSLVLVVRRRLLQQLVQLARIDSTTKLLNREAWLEEIKPWLEECEAAEEPVLLAIAGLDHFKEVNARQGFRAGDRLLDQVSRMLRAGLEEGEWLGRLSGDQFALCIRGGAADGDRLKQLCRELAERSWEMEPGQTVTLTMSMGVASSAGPAGWVLNLLLAQADRNLRLAKQEGGNRAIHR